MYVFKMHNVTMARHRDNMIQMSVQTPLFPADVAEAVNWDCIATQRHISTALETQKTGSRNLRHVYNISFSYNSHGVIVLFLLLVFT